MVDEAERSLHDALSVLSQTVKETRTVLGGGCSEMLMSCAVEEAARSVKGKKAIATEAFAKSLRAIPVILADNAGFDSSDLVTRLRAAHWDGQVDAGLGMWLTIYLWMITDFFLPPPFISHGHFNFRHGRRSDCIDENVRCNRELQAQETSRVECE